MRKALPLLSLLMFLASFAQTQTTTSHPVTGGSGTATTPTRISFTAMGGTQFFESGYGPSCSGRNRLGNQITPEGSAPLAPESTTRGAATVSTPHTTRPLPTRR